MGKLFIGVIVGAALTTAAFVAFERLPDGRAPNSVGAALSQTNSTAPEQRPESPLSNVIENEDTIAIRGDEVSEFESSDSEFRAEDLTNDELEEIVFKSNRAMVELRRRSSLAAWASQPVPDQPIVLPPEFDWLATTIPSDTHERLQREPVDFAWAPEVEAQLHMYFSARPEITGTLGYPLINCRTTLCEMAFVVPDVAKPALAEQQELNRARLPWVLQRAMTDFSDHPVANEFEFDPAVTNAATNVEDGEATLLRFLSRKESQVP